MLSRAHKGKPLLSTEINNAADRRRPERGVWVQQDALSRNNRDTLSFTQCGQSPICGWPETWSQGTVLSDHSQPIPTLLFLSLALPRATARQLHWLYCYHCLNASLLAVCVCLSAACLLPLAIAAFLLHSGMPLTSTPGEQNNAQSYSSRDLLLGYNQPRSNKFRRSQKGNVAVFKGKFRNCYKKQKRNCILALGPVVSFYPLVTFLNLAHMY